MWPGVKGQVHPKNIVTHLWRVHNVLSIGTMHSPKWKSSVKLWSEVLSWLPLSEVKQGKFPLAIVMSQTILVCVCEQSICKPYTFAQETINSLYPMFILMVVYSLSISDLYH